MDEHEPMYDWNEAGERWEKPAFRIQLDDQTLRDGLQASSVFSPSLERKLAILEAREAKTKAIVGDKQLTDAEKSARMKEVFGLQ